MLCILSPKGEGFTDPLSGDFKNDFSFSKRKAARSSTSDQPSKSDNAVTIDLMMMGG
jgi:hypothetical protein